jgi:PAS domain S-box-containing protein
MNQRATLRFFQLAAGVFLCLLGLLVCVRWSLQLAVIDQWLPTAGKMGLNSPLMLLFCGVALLLTDPTRPEPRWRQLLRNGCLAAVTVLAGLLLLETVSGLSFGIDFVRVPIAPTALLPHPGRPAPNTCICFLLAAASLHLANRRPLTARLDLLRQTFGALLCITALAALIGYLLNLSSMYRIAAYNNMLAPTSIALSVLGAALFLIPLERPWLRGALYNSIGGLRRKINASISAVLLLVAVLTGLAGFSTIREGLQQSLRDNILLTATTNATALGATLESRMMLPTTMVARTSVQQALAQLAAHPGDPAALAKLVETGDNLVAAGASAVRFAGVDGATLSQSGQPRGGADATRLALDTGTQPAALVWRDGYYLQTEHAVLADGVRVGALHVEQPLPAFQKLVSDVQNSRDSADVLICVRSGDDALCAPSRLYAQPKRIPMYLASGEINLPINHALLGQTGTRRTPDLRGVPVLAAYVPIAPFGLGMVVKVDEEAVFAPLHKRLIEFSAAVLLIIALGAVAVRFLVQPLLARLLGEQTRNRIILENSNDAFIALGTDGRVTDWNPQSEHMFGWSKQETLGKLLSELIIPAPLRVAHEAGLARFALSGKSPVMNSRIELIALRRDGTEFPVELSITGYRDDDGFVSNAFLRDISARSLAERQVLEQERFLRTVPDNIPALIAYVDREQRYRFANATYLNTLDADPDRIVGKTLRQTLAPEVFGALAPHIGAVLRGEKVHVEQAYPVRGVLSHFMIDYIPDLAEDGSVAGFYIMVMDITARKNAEIRQAESERRADNASRAKTEFVANMSHEIRTPMNAVLGIAQLLAATPMAADQRKYLDMIRQSGVSLLRILNDVLDFSKIEAGRLELVSEPFKLSAVVDAVATLMSVSAGAKPIELAVGIDPALPREFIGDALRLEQVLTNIVGNAIKFTAAGEVALVVEQGAREGNLVQLRFVVRDTGIGIPPEQLQRLFAPFSQGDSSMTRRFGGTGLGLTISRRLIELMQGAITVDSVEGQGSSFSVTVQLLAIHEAAPAPAPTGLPATLRLLVVDDNATSRHYITQAISGWGWQAQSAASGSEALALLAAAGVDEAYDAVLVDAHLPQFDGVRAAIIGSARPGRQAVVIQLLNPFERSATRDHGGDPLLLKPVTSSTLFDTLHTALAEAGAAPAPHLRAPGPQYRFDGARVLLVEDNAFNQIVAVNILEYTGALVTVCGDGLQAVEHLRAEPNGFDLVLMDVQMPVMDGFAATRAIRRELGLQLPVLAMTAGVMEDERERCAESGMNGFISKPVDVDQMLGLVRRHLVLPATPPAAASRADSQLGAVSAVFDIDKLLMMSAHAPTQRDNLLRLIAGITQSAPLDLAAARQAMVQGRTDEAAGILHALRGAVGAFGAQRFVEASLAAERALRSGGAGAADGADAPALLERARTELTATIEVATAVLGKLGVNRDGRQES